jgi:hypothetical protein
VVTIPERVVEHALRVWREAERLLKLLDETSPEAARVSRALFEAQSAYSSLVDEPNVTEALLSRTRQMIDEAESAIRGIEPQAEPLGG